MITNILTLFLQAIAAGVFISLGGFLFIGSKWLFTNFDSKYSEFGNVIGSCLFGVGLLLICITKMKLYTGKVGLLFEDTITCSVIISLFIMLIGNLGSTIGVGIFVNWLMKTLKVNAYLNVNHKVASSKLKLSSIEDFVKCAIQSMLCGSCVHLGVRCFNMFNGNFKGKILVIFCVFWFVYSGYQHCIANTFYFASSLIHDNNAYINVAICVVGNMFGTIPISLFTTKFNVLNRSSSLSTEESDEPINVHKRDLV